ncbi:hypothetical protein CGLO_11775 [Colletotrichum gloeosporioides Cg-14]|uniref:Xaa-Pro dipeptidyl-peptidase C-terminal domain-containing protein n=1 Tax=Colletotrichum gloeosporioides (strain Cg-14) TaxID=1237896 RepID=T0K7K1_COLGC|nr:hypothetical protein CGLO_11775 [Colletotrichum gloeosporioides Cg-14]
MNQDQFEKELARQLEIKDQALRLTRYKNGLSIDSKKARFPGFRQQKRNFKAGQQVEPGALPLSEDLVMHESVPTQLDDGTTLYSDIFLPASFQDLQSRYANPVPALVAWSPYGKQKGTTLLDDIPFRAGVPKERLSGLQKWEGPDPEFWCSRGYAVINVDTRGAYSSEGDLLIMGHQEAQDGASFITWVSKQPWCNGKVALTGNSWLAIAQWRIGSMRPPGLAALAPWEGFSDFYRHHMFSGGILFPGFHESISNTLATQGKLEDITSHAREHQLYDAYWRDKIAHPERINVPVYAAASWTNPVHTPGTFEAWEAVPDTVPKWLRIHNSQEWSDYYEDCNQKDLLRFFDRYLKDQKNDWETTPKVRLSVLHFGLVNQPDTVGRPEADFPLARTQYTKLFLQEDNTLSLEPDAAESALPYDSQSGKQTFLYQFDKACETTGYFCAHLVMSCPEHTDMDVFVQVEKLSALKHPQAVQTIKPQNVALQRLLKFMHDWNILPGGASMAFHRGPSGCLRGSFALGREEQRSKVYKPHYTFTEKISLKKGERRALDIPMSPIGMFWEVACIIDALPQSPCSGLNQTCLCADPVFNEEVSGCVKQGCTVSEALNVANMTWADCGFPLTDNTAIPRYLTGFLFILPVAFISIRLLNKAISPSPWGADDACALAGFACAAAMIPIVYRLLALGLGRDIWTLQPYKITEFLKLVFITQIFYITGLATIKASMLFFYLRVFPSLPFRRLLWVTQGFNALIFFLYLVLTFAQCRPLQKYWLGWSGDQPGVCMDFNLLVLTHVGFNIALDIWMLILPLTQLYKLKLGLKKKVGVIMMFSVGFFLTAVSALRIQVVAHFATANNITSEALWVYVWSLAELDVGVFVASNSSVVDQSFK